MASRPDEDGIDLSPDNPAGLRGPAEAPLPEEPENTSPLPTPGDDGIIAPGPTPESR